MFYFDFNSGLQQRKKVSLEVQFHPDFDFVTAASIGILSGDTSGATSAHFAIIVLTEICFYPDSRPRTQILSYKNTEVLEIIQGGPIWALTFFGCITQL